MGEIEMSLCFSYFCNNQIFVCADSRVSVEVDGVNHFVTDNYKKIRRIGNKVIFISGEVEIVENIFKVINQDSSINSINESSKGAYFAYISENKEAHIAVCILTIENNEPSLYFLIVLILFWIKN
jgi:hypothetical protein